MTAMLRTFAFVALAAFAVLRSSPAAFAAEAPKELRIGYQKSIGTLLILKEKGTLEKRLAGQGTAVTWVEFPSGPPLMEALHAGAIDFGYTGDMPPIYAQAAGVDFVYVASIPQPGKSAGVLVRADSGIKTLADLRGKRIAVVKGSSGHNVLVHALEAGKVAWSDVTPVYLQPADAGAALRAGNVDAWSIWDPFFALGERYPGVKVLTDAQALAPSNAFFLATRDYATRYPTTVENVIDESAQAWKWAESHQAELAKVLADATGVDLDVEQVVAARGNYDVLHMTPHVVKTQQAIADTFTKLGLLPHQINIAANVWTPSSTAASLSGDQRLP